MSENARPEVVPAPVLESIPAPVRATLGSPVTWEELLLREANLIEAHTMAHTAEVLAGRTSLERLLTADYLQQLHRDLFSALWSWAGQPRTSAVGPVDPQEIPEELDRTLSSLRARISGDSLPEPVSFAMTAHAEVQRIRPFEQGTGTTSRLLGDLVLAALTGGAPVRFAWDEVDLARYEQVLAQFRTHRDPTALLEVVEVVPLPDFLADPSDEASADPFADPLVDPSADEVADLLSEPTPDDHRDRPGDE